ncbi:MAG: NAD(P)-dependent oxidoreductase [Desulfovibrionaceae bacterium]|nr:NAD(P)-dependent oxidoreductase [Desulfovibrionaceae bacterium]
MNIAVVGADGQLGAELAWELQREHTVFPLYHETFDLTNYAQMQEFFLTHDVNCVLNAAGLNDKESCEKNPLQAFAVNALGARDLARLCQSSRAACIHISCDAIFDGEKEVPYVETDRPSPLTVYANSKVAGENFVLSECEKATVVRSGILYGKHQRRDGSRNIVEEILLKATKNPELYYSDSILICPTSAVALAKQICAFIADPPGGIIHASCHGACSWCQFAQRIMSLTNNITPVFPASQSSESLREPLFSALENRRLQQLGLDVMPFWEEALHDYLHAE